MKYGKEKEKEGVGGRRRERKREGDVNKGGEGRKK
jgi:hypothetical protein